MYLDILTTDVWLTIGFTYDGQKYYLIKHEYGYGLCLACTSRLEPKINAFCYECKAPQLLDWTTGNKSLDSFIMESWSNVIDIHDAYMQWIKYSLLTNVQEMTSLCHGCTHTAEWTTDELTRVTLKKIVDDQLFEVKYFTCKIINVCVSSCNDRIMYLFTQIANQGIPDDINNREYLDNWDHSGAIYSGILFGFLPRHTLTIGQVYTK